MLPVLAAMAADKIFNDGELSDTLTGGLGEAAKDLSNVGKNRFNATPYASEQTYFGGDPNAANNWSQMGVNQMGSAGKGSAYAQGQMQKERGPQAFEHQTLSDREAYARGYDQNGSIQLAREAAMGQAPSEAAYAMQAGLDRSQAANASQAGSARGAGAMALAGANASAAGAAMNQQAFTEAGRLRAQEMANARGLYGQLSAGQREQDLQRLGMGNQMSMGNAQMNDQYRLGMGQLGAQYSQAGQGWYNSAMDPQRAQLEADIQQQKMNSDNWNQAQALNSGVSQANADAAAQMRDRWISMAAGGAKTVGSMIPQGGGGGGGSGGSGGSGGGK